MAEFIGSPAMNVLHAEVSRSGGRVVAVFSGQRLLLDDEALVDHPALVNGGVAHVMIGIRPEDLSDASSVTSPVERRIEGVVEIREDMGPDVYVHASLGNHLSHEQGRARSDDSLPIAPASSSLVIARLDRQSRAREGDRLELAVATDRLNFFDPDTGESLRPTI